MQAQQVYLHPYCLVATRTDKIHIPALGHTCWHRLPNNAKGIFYSEYVCCVSPFLFPQHATSNGMFALPANVNEINSVVRGDLSREVKSPSCGRCINDTGPSVYSVGVECVSCSPINVVYYIFLQYLPSEWACVSL